MLIVGTPPLYEGGFEILKFPPPPPPYPPPQKVGGGSDFTHEKGGLVK